MQIIYEEIKETPETFYIETNELSQIICMQSPEESYGMNWVRNSRRLWGEVTGTQDLTVKVSREFTSRGGLLETYCFQNNTKFDIYTAGTELGICTPFPDEYAHSEESLKRRCHAHIWCGGSSSYIMALRMGGEAPHLGLILRKGSLKGYSVERMSSTSGIEEELSNHRGDFILHPESLHIRPGESYTIAWELLWFKDREEFQKLLSETEGFLRITSDAFVLIEGEEITFDVETLDRSEGITVCRNGKNIPYTEEGRKLKIHEKPGATGEYRHEIRLGKRATEASFLVVPELVSLTRRRLHFIAEHQQCRDQKSHLYGAYLIYDNEEKRQYYGHRNDINGGRERVGMGILFAYYLQHCPDARLQESLDQYAAYVLRELYDEETGEVFNDAPRCNDYTRLYNAPWVGRFFLEMYLLTKEPAYLDRYMKCIIRFYQEGGSHFYAIAEPMYESVRIFQNAGRSKDAECLLTYYREHGDYIASCGKNYPSHEVAYEQGIVAPAAGYMGELYRLTGEEKYRKAALE